MIASLWTNAHLQRLSSCLRDLKKILKAGQLQVVQGHDPPVQCHRPTNETWWANMNAHDKIICTCGILVATQ